MLNCAQVKALFEQEAILIGSHDAVPEYRAIELFGKEAVDFAETRSQAGCWFNCFCSGGNVLTYLTYAGFQQAASYANVQTICTGQKDREKKAKGDAA